MNENPPDLSRLHQLKKNLRQSIQQPCDASPVSEDNFHLWTGKQRVRKAELSWESIYRSKAAYVAFDSGYGSSTYFSARIEPSGLIKFFPYAYIKQGVFDPVKHTLEIVMSDGRLGIEGRHLEDIYICLLENRLLLLNAGDLFKDFGGADQTFITKIEIE